MTRIDLVGTAWPVCLLEFQRHMAEVPKGEKVTVRVRDPEVMAEVKRLAVQTGSRVLSVRTSGGQFRLQLQK